MADFYGLTGGCNTGSRPVAPTAFGVTQKANTTMDIGWTETASVFTNYSIERSTSASTGFVVVYTGFPTLPLGAVTMVDTGLTANTRYYYRFRVWNRNKWSTYQTDNEITTNV